MANTTNAEKAKKADIGNKELEDKNKLLEKKNKELASELSQMKGDMEEIKRMLMAGAGAVAPQPASHTVVNTTSKMDTPCSIIHLQECHPELPNTIKVNNVTHFFSKFGERKTFRYAELQNVLSQYRNFFARGIFTLADDCDPFVNELPEDIVNMKVQESTLYSLVSVDLAGFKRIVESMAYPQVVQVAMAWRAKAIKKQAGYDDLAKIKYLNKKTKPAKEPGKESVGLLESLISQVAKEED